VRQVGSAAASLQIPGLCLKQRGHRADRLAVSGRHRLPILGEQVLRVGLSLVLGETIVIERAFDLEEGVALLDPGRLEAEASREALELRRPALELVRPGGGQRRLARSLDLLPLLVPGLAEIGQDHVAPGLERLLPAVPGPGETLLLRKPDRRDLAAEL